MKVLSLFDGISCGRLALERSGIKIDRYISSEIDKSALIVSKDNFKDISYMGDVRSIDLSSVGNIDLLIGGSPCQGFSYAGKGLNFEDDRSKLFFEYVKALNILKPEYFLLENVNMIQEWQDVISSYLGVRPVFINSKLVSAQDRKRLYWTNIPFEAPKDKNISWSDINKDGWFAGSMRGRRVNEYGKRDDYNKSLPLIQYIESRTDNKTNCVTTVSKDNVASFTKVGRTALNKVTWRYLNRNEMESLQTLPHEYTKSVSVNKAGQLIGNAWTVDVIVEIFKSIL